MRVQLNGTVLDNDTAGLYRRWGYSDVCCPQDVRDALAAPEDQEGLIFEINSGGGSAYRGLEMYTLIRDSKRHVTVEIQSIAASAASVIAAAADTVRISPVANIMIHRASTSASGNEQDMTETGQMLRTADESILSAYENKCKEKKTRAELRTLMEHETFFTAQEALDCGLADEIMWADQDPETSLTKSAVAMAGGIRQAFASLPPIEELKRGEQRGAENNTGEPGINKEERKMPVTMDELEKENKELLNEIRSAAAKAERDRLSAIEGMSMAGFEDIISAAKQDPNATYESVAVQIVASQKKQGGAFLKERDKDVKDSNVGEVGAEAPQGKDDAGELDAFLDRIFKSKKEGN